MASVAVDYRLKKKVYDSPEELRLVHRAKRGDTNAFDALYHAHHNRVFVTIKRMIADEDASLWVANSALHKVWRGLAKFKEQSKFSTWVTRIAINEARMHIRSEKRRFREVSLDTMLQEGTPNPGSMVGPLPPPPDRIWLACRDLNLEGIADRELIARALDNIPQQFREILRLRFWEGMSMQEIQAKISDGPELVSIPAVKTRILRGRTFLMEEVERI